MPDTPTRGSTDNIAMVATQFTTTHMRVVPPRRPSATGFRFPLMEGSGQTAPSVAALLALNATLIARNFALLAALDRYDRTAGTRLARKEGVMPASISHGAILHLVPAQRSEAIERDVGRPSASFLSSLTPRQTQILHLVLAGHPSKNIAADLNISQRTVENHRAAIMRRTGATSLPALARMAVGADGSADCKAVSPT